MRLFAALFALVFSGFLAGCASDSEGEAPLTEGSSESALASPAEADAFWKKYERSKDDIEKEWRSNNGGKPWGGDYLAWHESFVEEALVDMYLATKDPKFVDEAIERMDVVFSLRDDVIDRKDEVRGKVVKAWGRYPDVGRENRTGTWVCEMVQNGLITYPIAELVGIIEKAPKGSPLAKYADKAARYREKLVDTVDAFDADWDGDFVRFPKGYAKVYAPHEGRWLPYNRALLMGKTMIALEETDIGDGKKQKYRERVRGLAKFFLDDARKVDDGTRLVWNFATWAPTVEDTSHGGLDASFLALAGKRGYTNVGAKDIDRVIETFRKITRDEKQLLGSLDGEEGNDKKDANEVCGRYLDLAAYEPSLANRCKTVIENGFDERQHGYAKMLRWRRR